jgi:hypothetical protein
MDEGTILVYCCPSIFSLTSPPLPKVMYRIYRQFVAVTGGSGGVVRFVMYKGVGRGPTLAWPGWKQPDISVKVDTARLEAGQFKKCCMECVLLYYPSTEF